MIATFVLDDPKPDNVQFGVFVFLIWSSYLIIASNFCNLLAVLPFNIKTTIRLTLSRRVHNIRTAQRVSHLRRSTKMITIINLLLVVRERTPTFVAIWNSLYTLRASKSALIDRLLINYYYVIKRWRELECIWVSIQWRWCEKWLYWNYFQHVYL